MATADLAHRPALGRRWTLASSFVAVPALLGAVWLARTPPPHPECFGATAPALAEAQASWLDDAGVLFGAGGVLVLAGLGLVSSWRSAAAGRGRRPGRPTLAVAVPLSLYVMACAADHGLFFWFGFAAFVVGILPVVAGVLALGPVVGETAAAGLGLGALVVLVVAVHWARTPGDRRGLGLLAAVGWCSLLLGVGGIAFAISLPVIAPLCLD